VAQFIAHTLVAIRHVCWRRDEQRNFGINASVSLTVWLLVKTSGFGVNILVLDGSTQQGKWKRRQITALQFLEIDCGCEDTLATKVSLLPRNRRA
jgi:hypothetical protein